MSQDTEHDAGIHRAQVNQIVRSIPFLVMFHAAAAFCLSSLIGFSPSQTFTAIWQTAVVAIVAAFAAVFVLWRKGRWNPQPLKALRALEVMCLAFGFIWALPITSAAYYDLSASIIPITGITLAVLGIAALALVRLPAGTVIILCLVSAALARALYQGLENYQLIAALLCACYCLVLVGITLNSHLDFRRRTNAEIEISRQNDVIRLLLNDFEKGTQDWLWETDGEGKLTYAARRLAECLNIDTSALLGHRLKQLFVDHAPTTELRTLDLAFEEATAFENIDIPLTVDTTRYVWRFSAQPLKDADGQHIGHRGVCRDITKAHQSENRLEAAMDASDRASTAKSHFLAVMSHELRTPINSIIGFSELLAGENAASLNPKSRKEFADTILTSARSLQALINDMIDTARMERGTLKLAEQDADAAELTEAAIKRCRNHAEKSDISIVAKLSDEIAIHCDATRLQQAISNLLSNAIKFSTAGGIINVEMQRGSDGEFVLDIKDAGIGIPKQDLERVFDPFVQSDEGHSRQYGGAGLGLPIARRIARLHDGDVTLESAVGAGTTARLILPAKRVHWPSKQQPEIQNVA